jgi:hypothetical protein
MLAARVTPTYFLALTVAVIPSVAGPNNVGKAQVTQPVPQLIYMRHKGLDTQRNPLDRLIGVFGFTCHRNPYNPKPCRIERELQAFIISLSKERVEVARQLISLGANCANLPDRLRCSYERQVENSAWIMGAEKPVRVIEELFRIDMTIANSTGTLLPTVRFSRTSKVKEQFD